MSKYETAIREAVTLRGSVTVAELADALDVSGQTVRRIIKPMVDRGEVRKVHGAIVSARSAMDPPFLARMHEQQKEKAAIAAAVAQLIDDDGIVAIDTGSTSAYVAQALRVRRNLTVVTNSAFVASTLSMIEGNRVFMAGSRLRDHDGAAFDRAAFDVIAGFKVDYAILSASEVHPERGFLVQEQCEKDIAGAMMEIASFSVMAVDCAKFRYTGRRPLLSLPRMLDGSIIVTEATPDSSFNDLLKPYRVEIAAAQAG